MGTLTGEPPDPTRLRSEHATPVLGRVVRVWAGVCTLPDARLNRDIKATLPVSLPMSLRLHTLSRVSRDPRTGARRQVAGTKATPLVWPREAEPARAAPGAALRCPQPASCQRRDFLATGRAHTSHRSVWGSGPASAPAGPHVPLKSTRTCSGGRAPQHQKPKAPSLLRKTRQGSQGSQGSELVDQVSQPLGSGHRSEGHLGRK